MERGKRSLFESAYVKQLIEVVLYFLIVGFIFGSVVFFACLAPLLMILTFVWVSVVLCIWPLLLPLMIALKHTHIVRKTYNWAIEYKKCRTVLLYLYDKICSL